MTNISTPRIGKIFGRLKVLGQVGIYLRCECTCGVVKLVRTDRVKSGKTRSCGCLSRERIAAMRKPPPPPTPKPRTRTLEERRLYSVWRSMVRRCTNPKDAAYKNYGGRGIGVCPAWMDFQQFYFEMAPWYRPGLWLERLDNNRGYDGDNCTFRTPTRQARNRRNNLVFADGGKLTDVREGEYPRRYRAFQRCIRVLGRAPTQQEWRREFRYRSLTA